MRRATRFSGGSATAQELLLLQSREELHLHPRRGDTTAIV